MTSGSIFDPYLQAIVEAVPVSVREEARRLATTGRVSRLVVEDEALRAQVQDASGRTFQVLLGIVEPEFDEDELEATSCTPSAPAAAGVARCACTRWPRCSLPEPRPPQRPPAR